MQKRLLLTLMLMFIASCNDPRNNTDIVEAVEIICPGAPRTLALKVSKKELREALRKQYTYDKTRNTVLKLKDGSNIMIPGIKPMELNRCIIRSLPEILIPTSQGY